jgi:RND family efflux transporter MFP subunit
VKKLIVILVVAALAGGGAYYGWVYRPAHQPDPAPVVTEKVERGNIRTIVASNGRVVSNLDVDIKCKASGEIRKLPFDVSDEVKKDALLVELNPVDEDRVVRQCEVRLRSAEAQLEIARRNLAVAERTLTTDCQKANAALNSCEARAKDARLKADRLKELFAKKLSSQEELETAETAAVQAGTDLETAKVKLEELKTQEVALELKRQEVKQADSDAEAARIALEIAQDRLHDTKVVAPIDGVVSVRNVQIGQIISSGISNVGGGTTMLTLSDLTQIFVLAAVDESDIGKVKLDQDVLVRADAYRGKRFRGKVVRIATRGVNLSNVVTFEVKIEVVGEAKALLKPEMTTNVEITTAEKENVLLVPAEAVVIKAGKQYATVVKDDETKEDVPVKIDLTDGNKTEVAEGLTEGQTVVVYKGSGETKWSGAQKQGGPPRGMMFGAPPRKR